MNVIDNVRKLGLEGLMQRANIIFTNGYRFCGSIDEECFAQSVKAICHEVIKFKYQVNFMTQDNYTWDKASERTYALPVMITADLEQAFTQLCQNIFTTLGKSNSEPMLFTLIKHECSDEFIIAQSCDHTYVDARSAQVIFNHIINHYNALCSKDSSTANDIILMVKALRTLPADQIIDECFKGSPQANHEKNVAKIVDSPNYDLGQHVIPISALDNALADYRTTPQAPLIQYFNVDTLIRNCREKYPSLSKNSIICAAITKAIYTINVQEKAVDAKHNISFKMVSDILSPGMRQQYSGNYIAFVPITVDGEKPLEDIAYDINCTVVDFKANELDTSVFALTEEAIRSALVGTADDPLSFVVTNWNNFSFIEAKDFLLNCQSIRHQSGVNINPQDSLGAALVNRPVLVINFSPDGELCISQFPSLSAATVNDNLAQHLNIVLQHEDVSR